MFLADIARRSREACNFMHDSTEGISECEVVGSRRHGLVCLSSEAKKNIWLLVRVFHSQSGENCLLAAGTLQMLMLTTSTGHALH